MAEANADNTSLPYKKLAGFHLKRLLGEGGMGAVYEAVHPTSHGHVALKIMREELASNPGSVERFEAEARNLAALKHPCVAEYVTHNVHRRGKRKPLYYLAMRFLQGCTLEQYVEKYGPRPVEEAIWIIAQACRGIHAAHEAEILHRDIKPANIFLVHEGDGRITGVRVIDFGIAKVRDEDDIDRLTRTGLWLGTLAYASPEQLASAKDLDYRSDIYSLGLVLSFLLTGKHAFDGKSAAVVYGMQTNGIPEIPSLDTGLMNIIRKATTFKREDRYEDVAGLIIALELCRPDLFMAPPASEGSEPTPAVAPTAVMPHMMPAPAVLYGLPPATKASDNPDVTDEHYDSVPRVVKWFAKILLLAIFLG
ncbi:serine/threonine protein kinase, partial [Patescibacteria group bacterium]|nr:serine/threonine protein kinase [Patescibacteria group bacterium]